MEANEDNSATAESGRLEAARREAMPTESQFLDKSSERVLKPALMNGQNGFAI